MIDVDDIVGVDVIATLLDVQKRTVNLWVKAGMPKVDRGKYRIRDCVKWYVARISADRGGGDLHDERIKLVKQQRQRVELENARSKGELVAIDDVEDILNRVGVIIATQLDGLAPRVAQKLATIDDPSIVQSVLFGETRLIRESVAREFTNYASDSLAR